MMLIGPRLVDDFMLKLRHNVHMKCYYATMRQEVSSNSTFKISGTHVFIYYANSSDELQACKEAKGGVVHQTSIG